MSIWPDRELLNLLGIEHGIIQAPMAGSTSPALASAVSEAGALGSLGCAMMDRDAVRREVGELSRLSNRTFNVNFFCHRAPRHDPARNAHARSLLEAFYQEMGAGPVPEVRASNFPFDDAMLETVLELRPRVVSFHFGLPAAAMVEALRSAGTVVLSSATTAREARILEDGGVHAVIAQGFEAGGHRGHFSTGFEAGCVGTMALVPRIVDAVEIPVIAAGGIADGRGIAAALMLGASAVQMGTAFLSTDEAPVPAAYRDAILGAQESDTRLTRAFSGGPARGIRNQFMDRLSEHDHTLPDFPLMNTLTRPLREAAATLGSTQMMSLWAGQGLTLNRAMPAAKLVEVLVEETRTVLRSRADPASASERRG